MRIVGVHGAGQYRSGENAEQARLHLADIWRKHLCRGPLGAIAAEIDIVAAYYADVLQTPGEQGGTENLANLEPEAVQLVRWWLEELDPPAGIAQGIPTAPLRQTLAWVAQTRGLGKVATERFVATFFREVARYLMISDGSARSAARQAVIDVFTVHEPDIVIAHSLGTVIAYEALWATPRPNIETFVTLGSPLALPHAIFPRLIPPPTLGYGAKPPGVRRWINIADPGDIVAIPPGGVSRQFAGVDVDDSTIIHMFDFHRVANYLACHRLGALLTHMSRPERQ
jgi:pimeloyl-ACP methyl ester carboxylesterase